MWIVKHTSGRPNPRIDLNQNPQDVLEQLRNVLATTLDTSVQLAPGTMSQDGWRIRVVSPGVQPLAIAFDAAGAAAIAAALVANDNPSADAVANVLHDLCSHTFTGDASASAGEDVQVEMPEFVEHLPVQGVTVAGLRCERLGVTVAISVGRGASAETARRARPNPSVGSESARFGVLMDIDLPMVVRFGCTDMPLKSLSHLGPGSLIDLSRAPEDPVEVLVGGRVVARGEVVVVSGSYGIRIVDVVEGRPQALGMEA